MGIWKEPKKINILEHILFLMQMDCLAKFGKPFYKYKTYIYNGNVRIPYLSDLLSVSPIENLIRDRNIDKYVEIFKKYRKMSDDVENDITSSIDVVNLKA